MKALSVHSEHVSNIMFGLKTIELRSRPIKHRGDLLIVSSKSGIDMWAHEVATDTSYMFPKGVQCCVVEVVDCRPATEDDAEAACYYDGIQEGTWAWEIKLKYITEFTPQVGRLNLFDVPDEKIIRMPQEKVDNLPEQLTTRIKGVPKKGAYFDF